MIENGRSGRVTYKITNLDLENLRWLVKQCEGMPDNSKVSVKEYKYFSPVDHDQAYIEVSGDFPKEDG